MQPFSRAKVNSTEAVGVERRHSAAIVGRQEAPSPSRPNSPRAPLVFVRIVAWLAIFASAFVQPSFAAEQSAHEVIEQVRSALSDVENELKADNLTDSDLARLRQINDPLGGQLQTVIGDLTPRLAASDKRLAELSPKSKETAAAAPSDTLADELQTEQAKHDALDADLKLARALLLQTDEDANRIGASRRNLFAKQTFARSLSVLSPLLWVDLAREGARDMSVIAGLLSDWRRSLSTRLSVGQALGFLALTLALAASTAPARWIAARVLARDRNRPSPTRLRRALAALWTIIVLAGIPLAMLGVFAYALDAFDISDPQLQGAVYAALDGLRLIAIAYAFGRGLLAPREGRWRLINLGDRASTLLFRGLMFIAVVWSAERLLEAVAEATASLNISIASRALGATLIALAGVGVLRRIVDPRVQPPPGRDPWAPARTLAWVFIAVLFAAAALGYIAFAAFLVNHTLVVFAVGGSLYLADALVQESAQLLLEPDASIGLGLMTIIGLRRDTMEQIVVIAQGFARLAALITALVVTFAPFGLPSQDISTTLRDAYFGLTIGGVTISLSSLLTAGLVFIIGVIATRAVQNWLGQRYLPRTRLDDSVNHSIRAITGYVGIIIALLVSGARLGLDLQQFALVAGALSVGIGFGLQSIVNNFVAGLILLWERDIRVGDWVVVGAEQGFVRKIKARATEIETFERSTLVVPNSTLVTTSVKNWTLTDRLARIVVRINVAHESDAEAVRELLIAAARAQELVQTFPAPLALFSGFGDWSLMFDLYCYVDDALVAEKVHSELNFDVLRRLREAGIQLAAPYAKTA